MGLNKSGCSKPHIRGVIKLWGRVQVGELGYRSEYAEIIGLFHNDNPGLQEVAQSYQVPIYTKYQRVQLTEFIA